MKASQEQLCDSEVPSTSFLKFLMIRDDQDFNLGRIHGFGSEVSDLIVMQNKALQEHFFEKMRGNLAVEFARMRALNSLCSSEFDDETNWLLDNMQINTNRSSCFGGMSRFLDLDHSEFPPVLNDQPSNVCCEMWPGHCVVKFVCASPPF